MKSILKHSLLVFAILSSSITLVACSDKSSQNTNSNPTSQVDPSGGQLPNPVVPDTQSDEFASAKSTASCNRYFDGTKSVVEDEFEGWHRSVTTVKLTLAKEGGYILEVQNKTEHHPKYSTEYTSSGEDYHSGTFKQDSGFIQIVDEAGKVIASVSRAENPSGGIDYLNIVPISSGLANFGLKNTLELQVNRSGDCN